MVGSSTCLVAFPCSNPHISFPVALTAPINRASLAAPMYTINELLKIKDVDSFNRDLVVDLLQSVVEIVTYGDKHDPSIFECFMEHQVLAEFVRMLKISKNSGIEAKVLQYLSIMIQNLHSEHAIYYCFSNGYMNNIITHEFAFDAADLVSYYVSFLRALSGKLNRDTIGLLLKVQEGIVTSFPLYTEALRFAHHGEKMIQTAIRSLTLSIYDVSDDMVYQFLMTPPVSEHLSDLILKLREECVHLDTTLSTMGENYTTDKRSELIAGIDKLLDDLYYVKDLLCVGKSRLSTIVTQKLLGLLVIPIMIPLMQLGKKYFTSLYLVARLLQVLDRKEMLDSVACVILYPQVHLSPVLATGEDAVDRSQIKTCFEHVNKIAKNICSSVESQGVAKEKAFGHAWEQELSVHHSISFQWNDVQARNGILSHIFSDNPSLLLASLMILIVLAESNDVDDMVASVFGFPRTHSETDDAAVLELPEQCVFLRCMPQILNALLNILGSTPSLPMTQSYVGWFILKLIAWQRSPLSHQELHLFTASFHQARERLLDEVSGCFFDYIPVTIEKKWESCKRALGESSQNKDPLVVLELAFFKQSSDGSGIDAWQRMVDAVKIFVLHLQLKAYVIKGCLPNYPLRNSQDTSLSSPRSIHDSDASSAKFGSQPKIDEKQATWLHLRIRDFTSKLLAKKSSMDSSKYETNAKWTLGFSDAEACDAACLLIAEETCKQRSSVECSLAPYLHDDYPGDEPDVHGH